MHVQENNIIHLGFYVVMSTNISDFNNFFHLLSLPNSSLLPASSMDVKEQATSPVYHTLTGFGRIECQ